MLARMVRDPLFVFFLAGCTMFGAYSALQARSAQPVQLSAETRMALITGFESVAGRPANADDIARIERDYIVDELLFRDALDNGLHLSDTTVRGRLVEEMRLRITGLLPDPSDEQLVNHYAENTGRYFSEPALTFEHVYFRSRPADDQSLLARLQGGEPVAGEPFAQGRAFPGYGRSIIRGLFGQPFTTAAWAAPLGEWSGPFESSQGWHYVHPTERAPGALLPFDAVRDQVENDFLVAVIQQAVDQRVAALEQRYDVRIER